MTYFTAFNFELQPGMYQPSEVWWHYAELKARREAGEKVWLPGEKPTECVEVSQENWTWWRSGYPQWMKPPIVFHSDPCTCGEMERRKPTKQKLQTELAEIEARADTIRSQIADIEARERNMQVSTFVLQSSTVEPTK